MTAGYEFFDHTADVGFTATGATRAELLEQCARAVGSLLAPDSAVIGQMTRPVELTADSFEQLLMRWLKELVFWFSGDRFLASSFNLEVTDTTLMGTVAGEPFDPFRHAVGTEIKGVTYHEFDVRQTGDGWQARVIVDV